MRRFVLYYSWIICSFAGVAILFQNCSKYKPELNASPGYSVAAESIDQDHSNTDAALADIVRGSTVHFSQSVPEFSNIWAPVFVFSMNDSSIDPYTKYLCKVDGQDWSSCTNPLKLEGLNDGMHSLSVKAVFKGTTYSLPKNIVWTKDSLAPLVVFNKTPPANIGTNEVEITFSATDGGSGVQAYSCLFDDQEWSTCTSPISYAGLANGPHRLKVRVTDKSGNINEASTSWTIDPAYPYISLTTKPDAFIKDSEATFSFEVMNGLSFNQFECLFSSETVFSACASGVKFNVLTDGLYEFKVRARDSQGYYTSTLSYQFYRDATAPKIELVSPGPGSKSKNSLVIAMNIEDGQQGSGVGPVSCVIESLINTEQIKQSVSGCSFPLDLSTELTGEYHLTVMASDKLGNESTSARFQFLYVNEEHNPAFLTVNLSGGAALIANVIPLDNSENFLDNYGKMGMGDKSFVETNHEKYLGANWYTGSGLMKGIKKHLSSDGANVTRVYALPVPSLDNTSNNPFDIQPYVASAGLRGTFVRATANANGKMLNGINQTKIFFGKSELDLDLPAVFRPFVGFLDLANQAGYTEFEHFPMIENHDAYQDGNFVTIFGTDINQSSTVEATKQIIYNSINGNSGPANLNFDGFDYHNVTRTTSDSHDEVVGEWLGKAMQYAYVMKKKLMIYVPTDGTVSSAESAIGGGDWISDRGSAGQLIFFTVDPFAQPPVGDANDYMIGHFNSAQDAEESFWTSTDARPDQREIAAVAVVANYLKLAGLEQKIEAVTQGVITQEEAAKYLRVK